MPEWRVNFDIDFDDTNADIIRCVERIRAIASVINGIPIPPGVQRKLDSLNILRAVRGTTGIEGTELTEEEVDAIIDAGEGVPVLNGGRRREEQEVRNANELMLKIKDLLSADPSTALTEELVKDFHFTLTKGIGYPDNEPGRYRRHAVRAGTYIPPRTYEEVAKYIREFIAWFNQGKPKGWDEIVSAIVAHFYVVSIHPFGDGDGRVSRAVESFLLYRAGINARGFYSLANYYYRNRADYVGNLDYVRFESNNNITPFVVFALKGLVEELDSVHGEVLSEVRLITYRDYVREELLYSGRLRRKTGERRMVFINVLARETKGVRIEEIKSGRHMLSSLYHNVTAKTLTRDINYFLSNKIITEENGVIKANLSLMDRYVA